jgi:5,10-methylenetetrahydromethanopterin reductase
VNYGIILAPVADSWKTVKRAEELGFTRAWFFDTQMLNAELFVSMTAAAMATSRIRLGTGVLIPTNRIAPVAASALASLNALAPGRIDFGVSTGFTGRRTLGVGPVKLADMAEYIRVVQGLLAGETVEWDFEAVRKKIRFLDPDIGAINIRDQIPLHISAFGPRGRKLTVDLRAGWINNAGTVQNARTSLSAMQTDWAAAGHASSELQSTLVTACCVLRQGEGFDSPRVKAQVGPNAVMALHSLVEREEFGDIARPVPPHLASLVDKYRQVYLSFKPEDARYLSNHRGHLMYLKPEEESLCTPELIRNTTWTASKEELRERIREVKAAGYSEFTISLGYGHEGRMEDWIDVISGV